MTASHDIRRRLARYYESEPPLRAPDWVLHAALSTIEMTPQRRGPALPRRIGQLSTFTKLAAAAVVVIAVGGFAVMQLAQPGHVGPPVPTPSPTTGPVATPQPTSTPAPTAATYVPPPLGGAFTSTRNGLSLSYPSGWTVQAATAAWTSTDAPQFADPAGDLFWDPVRADHLFLVAASQPLAGTSFDTWLSAYLTSEQCARTGAGPVIPGADQVTQTTCDLVLASSGGRGYVFQLYTSSDDPDLRTFDARSWLDDILATVRLHPEAAASTAPTPSP